MSDLDAHAVHQAVQQRTASLFAADQTLAKTQADAATAHDQAGIAAEAAYEHALGTLFAGQPGNLAVVVTRHDGSTVAHVKIGSELYDNLPVLTTTDQSSS